MSFSRKFNRKLFKEAFKLGYKKALKESKEIKSLKKIEISIKLFFKKFYDIELKNYAVMVLFYCYGPNYDPETIERKSPGFESYQLNGDDVEYFFKKIQDYIEREAFKADPNFISGVNHFNKIPFDYVDVEFCAHHFKRFIANEMYEGKEGPNHWKDKKEYKVVLQQTIKNGIKQYDFVNIYVVPKEPTTKEEQQLMLPLKFDEKDSSTNQYFHD